MKKLPARLSCLLLSFAMLLSLLPAYALETPDDPPTPGIVEDEVTDSAPAEETPATDDIEEPVPTEEVPDPEPVPSEEVPAPSEEPEPSPEPSEEVTDPAPAEAADPDALPPVEETPEPDELPPVEEELMTLPVEAQASVTPPVLPGYTQITGLPLDESASYIIVGTSTTNDPYALHLNADGTTNHNPGTTAYSDCTATLTINGDQISAVRTSDTSTAVAMAALHVTISGAGDNAYTIKNASHSLWIGTQMFDTASNTHAMILHFTDTGRFEIKSDTGSIRYLTFNVNNDGAGQGANNSGPGAQFPALPTGFSGWGNDQTKNLSIYLYQKDGTGNSVRDRLTTLVGQVEGLAEADYTITSYRALAAAISSARIVLADQDATDVALTQALSTLQSAQNALRAAPVIVPPQTATVYQRVTTSSLEPGVYVVYSQNSANDNRILYHTGTGLTDVLGGGSVANDRITLDGGFAAERQLWRLAVVSGGYTLQSLDSGRYLDLTSASANKVNTSPSPITLTITKSGNCYTIAQSNGNYLSQNSSSKQFSSSASDPVPLALFKDTQLPPNTLENDALVPSINMSSTQLFAPGDGGSSTFRIPAMVTLKHQKNSALNGRIVAAIDARWGHTLDGANIDTILGISDNNGKNWTYSYPNYFGDSTDIEQRQSATIMDPVILEANDGTIYLMVDIFHGGIAINVQSCIKQCVSGSGYVEIGGKQRLVLHTTSPISGSHTSSNYSYFVGDFQNGYATVYEAGGDNNVDSGFYVDPHYYIYKRTGSSRDPAHDKIYCQRLGASDQWVQQNVFFENACLHVAGVSFLWITKSTDGGNTWDDPLMVNPTVRTGNDIFYGVGPGAGLCMDDGTLLFPAYTFSNQISSFIYSKDNGATWHRGPNATGGSLGLGWSSESCLLQIGENTVRHFYRNAKETLCYTDHTWNGNGWTSASPVETSVPKAADNQLSAMKYSQKIDGKDVILISTASGTGVSNNLQRRTNGKIYTFLVNDDAGHTMELAYTYEVNGSGVPYAYSSLDELSDGSIALLYENDFHGAMKFLVIPFSAKIPDGLFKDNVVTYDGRPHSIVAPDVSSAEGLTVEYTADMGETPKWSSELPTFINIGTYTIRYKVTSSTPSICQDQALYGSVTLTIQRQPINAYLTANTNILIGNGDVIFTVSGIPADAKGTVTLQCLDDTLHAPHPMVKQPNGTYTFTHSLEGPQAGEESRRHTFEATYTMAETGSYTTTVSSTSTVIVYAQDPDSFSISATGFNGPYDGTAHSITVTVPDDVTVTYCETENGTFRDENFSYTDAGTHTVFYKASRGGKEVHGSATVFIGRVNPLASGILPSKSKLTDVDFQGNNPTPLTLTIPDVPAAKEGTFTLTCSGQSVQNLSQQANGSYLATPALPRETRSYTFVATFEPNPAGSNYNRIVRTCIVSVEVTPQVTPTLPFAFSTAATIDSENPNRATLTIPYDGTPHTPLEALVAGPGVSVTYSTSENPSFTDKPPAYTDAGKYTIICRATGADIEDITLTLTLIITTEPIVPQISLTASPTKLTGGGMVTLTPSGVPGVGTLKVSCSLSSITITSSGDGTYVTILPNATKKYTFRAVYTGQGNYQNATAECTVTVTADANSSTTGKPGTSGGGGGGGSIGSSTAPSTPGVTNPDGSVTTTSTDRTTGATTTTTKRPDGTVEVVKTEKDGTVTTTKTISTGIVVETVVKPEEPVTAKVTIPDTMESAKVSIPSATLDYSTVALDKAGNLILLSVPNETLDQMLLRLEESQELTLVRKPHAFEDVEEHWAQDAISFTTAHQLFQGVSDTEFAPQTTMSRGMLVTVLARLDGVDTSGGETWYEKGAQWAKEMEISDTYDLDADVSREQLATMLWRYAGCPTIPGDLSAFADGDSVSAFARMAMRWAVKQGIFDGNDMGLLAPQASASRAEVSTAMLRFCRYLVK